MQFWFIDTANILFEVDINWKNMILRYKKSAFRNESTFEYIEIKLQS